MRRFRRNLLRLTADFADNTDGIFFNPCHPRNPWSKQEFAGLPPQVLHARHPIMNAKEEIESASRYKPTLFQSIKK